MHFSRLWCRCFVDWHGAMWHNVWAGIPNAPAKGILGSSDSLTLIGVKPFTGVLALLPKSHHGKWHWILLELHHPGSSSHQLAASPPSDQVLWYSETWESICSAACYEILQCSSWAEGGTFKTHRRASWWITIINLKRLSLESSFTWDDEHQDIWHSEETIKIACFLKGWSEQG